MDATETISERPKRRTLTLSVAEIGMLLFVAVVIEAQAEASVLDASRMKMDAALAGLLAVFSLAAIARLHQGWNLKAFGVLLPMAIIALGIGVLATLTYCSTL